MTTRRSVDERSNSFTIKHRNFLQFFDMNENKKEGDKDLSYREKSFAVSKDSRRRLIREELDLQNPFIAKDSLEFRKVKLQLRQAGMSTGFGAIQTLHQKVTKTILKRESSKECRGN